jgi:hypothetical protein
MVDDDWRGPLTPFRNSPCRDLVDRIIDNAHRELLRTCVALHCGPFFPPVTNDNTSSRDIHQSSIRQNRFQNFPPFGAAAETFC